jgi:hypothetical protein
VVRVLELLTMRLTDREIANMVISPWTVRRHIDNIMTIGARVNEPSECARRVELLPPLAHLIPQNGY